MSAQLRARHYARLKLLELRHNLWCFACVVISNLLAPGQHLTVSLKLATSRILAANARRAARSAFWWLTRAPKCWETSRTGCMPSQYRIAQSLATCDSRGRCCARRTTRTCKMWTTFSSFSRWCAAFHDASCIASHAPPGGFCQEPSKCTTPVAPMFAAGHLRGSRPASPCAI